MTSIGYDIVDLALTDPVRSSQPRFYRQILSPSEYTCPGFLPFHQYLWLCWSVKEAVYKYACRVEPGITFSPTRIVLESLQEDLRGRAVWNGRSYRSTSSFADGYIASVAHNGEPFACAVTCPSGDPSQAVRSLVLGDAGPGWTVVSRADGCPTLVREAAAPPAGAAVSLLAGATERAVSFSHHGAYAGYALVLP